MPVDRPHQPAECRLAATDVSKVDDLVNTAGHRCTEIVTDVHLSYVKYEPRTRCRSKVTCQNQISVPFGPIRYVNGRARPYPPTKYELRRCFRSKVILVRLRCSTAANHEVTRRRARHAFFDHLAEQNVQNTPLNYVILNRYLT